MKKKKSYFIIQNAQRSIDNTGGGGSVVRNPIVFYTRKSLFTFPPDRTTTDDWEC